MDDVIEALVRLGIPRSQAKILLYLSTHDGATSKDVVKGLNLKQPEVSLWIKDLKQKGWVNINHVKDGKKGRPYQVYALAVSLPKIASQLARQRRNEIKDALTAVKKGCET